MKATSEATVTWWEKRLVVRSKAWLSDIFASFWSGSELGRVLDAWLLLAVRSSITRVVWPRKRQVSSEVSYNREQEQIHKHGQVESWVGLGVIVQFTNSINLSVFLLSSPLGLGSFLSIDSWFKILTVEANSNPWIRRYDSTSC